MYNREGEQRLVLSEGLHCIKLGLVFEDTGIEGIERWICTDWKTGGRIAYGSTQQIMLRDAKYKYPKVVDLRKKPLYQKQCKEFDEMLDKNVLIYE